MLRKEAAMPNTLACARRAARKHSGRVQLDQAAGKRGAKAGKLKRAYQTRPAALPALLWPVRSQPV